MSNKKNHRTVKKNLIRKQLQKDIDAVVPKGYSGEIRTDTMENYHKDADKYFDVLDKQLEVLRNFQKKRKGSQTDNSTKIRK